jgi:hypothetical protein
MLGARQSNRAALPTKDAACGFGAPRDHTAFRAVTDDST